MSAIDNLVVEEKPGLFVGEEARAYLADLSKDMKENGTPRPSYKHTDSYLKSFSLNGREIETESHVIISSNSWVKDGVNLCEVQEQAFIFPQYTSLESSPNFAGLRAVVESLNLTFPEYDGQDWPSELQQRESVIYNSEDIFAVFEQWTLESIPAKGFKDYTPVSQTFDWSYGQEESERLNYMVQRMLRGDQ